MIKQLREITGDLVYFVLMAGLLLPVLPFYLLWIAITALENYLDKHAPNHKNKVMLILLIILCVILPVAFHYATDTEVDTDYLPPGRW